MLTENESVFDEITFEEKYENAFTDEVELYFNLPKDYLLELNPEEYDKACGVSLCLTYLGRHMDIENTYARYSPVCDDEGVLYDYEWFGIRLSDSDKVCLLDMAINEN